MTTRRELHEAIDELSDEQVQRVIQMVEIIQARHSPPDRKIDLSRYSGILKLGEDPLAFQERVRNEWP